MTVLTGCAYSLDTDRPHLLDVGDASQYLLDAVLLQRAHAVVQARREHLGHPRMVLDVLLDPVRADQELVQADPALVARVAADVATLRGVEDDLAFLVAELLRPLLEHLGLPLLGVLPAFRLVLARQPLRLAGLLVDHRSP